MTPGPARALDASFKSCALPGAYVSLGVCYAAITASIGTQTPPGNAVRNGPRTHSVVRSSKPSVLAGGFVGPAKKSAPPRRVQRAR